MKYLMITAIEKIGYQIFKFNIIFYEIICHLINFF